MRYLITGGAGFIGSHFVEALLARGDAAVVLDDFSTGRRSNLAAVTSHPSLEVVEGSVTDATLVGALVAEVDHAVHLAAAVGVRKIMTQRVAGIRTNVGGTDVVLEACASRCRPFFFASTSEVYGKNGKVPFSEDDDSVLGTTQLHRWSYSCAKLLDEFLALAWFFEHRLPVTIARFFNVTGPRQSPEYGMVLPRFCVAALARSPLEVHGSGRQSRCFLHVDDCVRAMLCLVDSPIAVGQVVNVGSDEEITIRELAERVIALSGSSSKVGAVPYAAVFPEGGFEDMQRRVPDTRRLTRLTGWRRAIDLERTILDALRFAGESLVPHAR